MEGAVVGTARRGAEFRSPLVLGKSSRREADLVSRGKAQRAERSGAQRRKPWETCAKAIEP